ncbi:MAG: hypothetical protein ACLUFF_01685 [Acutalibacteraceae bacterium]
MQPNAKKQPMSRDCIICLAAGLVGYILLRLPVGIYGIGISLGVGVMYVAAYLLPIPAAVFCTVLPAVLADVIWGNFVLLPMTAVVTAVCQIVLCKVFVQYVQNNLMVFIMGHWRGFLPDRHVFLFCDCLWGIICDDCGRSVCRAVDCCIDCRLLGHCDLSL